MKIKFSFFIVCLLFGGMMLQAKSPVTSILNGNEILEKDSLRNLKFKESEQLIDSMNFILQANYLQNQRGYRTMVTPSLNFIKVKSHKAVLQTGSNVRLGPNGVGGITAEGTITGWKVIKNEKKHTLTVTFGVFSVLGNYSVIMNVYDGGKAYAYISGNGLGKIEYQGELVPFEPNIVYQGQTL